MSPNRVGVAPLEPNRLTFAIVGVPNAGKTTTKNMIIESQVATSKAPFHTNDTSLANGCILDPRCSALATKLGGSRAVPAKLNVIDTPGLVSGLSDDVGVVSHLYPMLGQADALLQVCRVFEADDVVHTEGTVDPLRDIEDLQNELIALDTNYIQDQLQKNTKIKDANAQQVLEKVSTCLQAGTPVRHGTWTSREQDVISSHRLITCKPIVYLINLSEADFVRRKNKWLGKALEWIKKNDSGAPVVPFCATFEERLQSLEGDDAQRVYMEEVGASKSMREKVVDAGYEATSVIRFYTKLNGVAMVWSVPDGFRAPQAAGVVHSDLEASFAGVEVTPWEDYNSEENDAALKQAGKLHQKGKDYVIADGDVIHFKSHGSPKNKPNSHAGSPTSKASTAPSTPVHKPHSNPSTPVHKPSKPSVGHQRSQASNFSLDE